MHAEAPRARKQTRPRGAQPGVFAEAVGLHPAGVPGGHALPVFVVNVENPGPALAEQHALAVHVFRHVLVLVASDMVRGKIGEHAVIEEETGHAPVPQADGRGLQNRGPAAGIHHAAQVLLHVVGFRRGVVGLHDLAADDDADGPDDARPDAARFENRADHIGNGGLPLGPRDADGRQLPRRMTEPRRGNHRKRVAGVLHHHDRGVPAFHRPLRHNRRGPRLGSPAREVVAVHRKAAQADEQAARRDLARIVHDGIDFQVLYRPAAGIAQAVQQFLQFHRSKAPTLSALSAGRLRFKSYNKAASLSIQTGARAHRAADGFGLVTLS